MADTTGHVGSADGGDALSEGRPKRKKAMAARASFVKIAAEDSKVPAEKQGKKKRRRDDDGEWEASGSDGE